MKLTWRPGAQSGLPMPLWLQGAFELFQSALLSAIVVLLPLVGVWFADGFEDRSFESLARLGGQAWLLIHGVPLQLEIVMGASSADTERGTLSLIPLGLTLLPFFLCWRAGRRLARASYTDQLWQAFLGALGIYAFVGGATAYLVQTDEVQISLVAGALIPLIPAGAGLVTGAYREAKSWGRLIGVDAAAWVAKTSQHSRWAGSYVWSAIRAGLLAATAAVSLSAALLAAAIALHWADIIEIYQELSPGIVGGAVLTVAQLGLLPNLVGWTLAWSSGAGFAIGTGSSATPMATTVGPMPAYPLLGALPTGELTYGLAALSLPVVAGILAGWWFLREGENHFDEWLAIKIRARWFTASASTLLLGVLVGLVAGAAAAGLAWLTGGSLGIGRLVDLGPDPLWTGVWVACEVALGVVIGYALGPWLEREPRRAKAAKNRK
ncbi:integral membrane protein [Arthrobacter crystallopoietes BAB-32]|uniref:Integral membrane protein n=1 Tax=Arthrobacter crystallopoietes BAB-32 TaxID=1246476 RepID=N1UZ12_9MICC|nr:DUF6350 family protein [Arthrobacter crystallopoietes]EMY33072.1 integral membrane protein [Arthrobacter crystallopoietes BAB-32]